MQFAIELSLAKSLLGGGAKGERASGATGPSATCLMSDHEEGRCHRPQILQREEC